MLDRQHRKLFFECDACGEVLDTETDHFNEALRILRNAGWRAVKVGQDWVHTCFACVGADDQQRSGRARRGGRIP